MGNPEDKASEEGRGEDLEVEEGPDNSGSGGSEGAIRPGPASEGPISEGMRQAIRLTLREGNQRRQMGRRGQAMEGVGTLRLPPTRDEEHEARRLDRHP